MKTRNKWMLYAAMVCLLGLVFSAYLQPSFYMTMANQLWTCF